MLEPAGPPAMRTGIGTQEVTFLKDSIEPVHFVLTTVQPNSNANLAACAAACVSSFSITLRFSPRGKSFLE